MITHENIQDLVKSVINAIGPMKFTQLAQEMQKYLVYPMMFQKGGDGEVKLKAEEAATGTGWEDKVLVNGSGNARNVGIWEPDNVNIIDGLKDIKGGWAHTVTNWGWEDHEIPLNGEGKQKLLDLIKKRREQAMLDLVTILENNFFAEPTADPLMPWGLRYWIVKDKSLSTSAIAGMGFNGGYAVGSDCAGLDHPNWKNFTGAYYSIPAWDNSGVTVPGDMIGKLRRAYRKCEWKSPLEGAEIGKSIESDLTLLVNTETLCKIEELLESRNDNLTRDVAPLFGRTCFKGFPFVVVNKLDEDSDNPIYGLNMNTFRMMTLKGFFNRESAPKDIANMHLASAVFIDNSYNWKCIDRRRNFVLHQVNSYAA